MHRPSGALVYERPLPDPHLAAPPARPGDDRTHGAGPQRPLRRHEPTWPRRRCVRLVSSAGAGGELHQGAQARPRGRSPLVPRLSCQRVSAPAPRARLRSVAPLPPAHVGGHAARDRHARHHPPAAPQARRARRPLGAALVVSSRHGVAGPPALRPRAEAAHRAPRLSLTARRAPSTVASRPRAPRPHAFLCPALARRALLGPLPPPVSSLTPSIRPC